MDPENIKLWMQAINMVGTFGLGVWMYLERRSDKTNERVSELSARLEKLGKDVAGLEAISGSAPTHADLRKVHESINALANTVHVMVGENRGQRDQIDSLTTTVFTLVGVNQGQSDTLRLILNQITQKGMQ